MAKKPKPRPIDWPRHKPKPKPPPPAPGPTGGATLEPLAGTVTPVGAPGAPVAPAGGDLTGTAALNALMAESVFGTGTGLAPQYNRQDQAATQQAEAITTTGQPVTSTTAGGTA